MSFSEMIGERIKTDGNNGYFYIQN